MVINATFNNISVISWRSVLLVEETVVSGDALCVMDSGFLIQLFFYENLKNRHVYNQIHVIF